MGTSNYLRIGLVLLVLGLLLGSCSRKAEPTIKPDADNGGLQLPSGFGAFIVADSLGWARHIAVRENGDIFVQLNSLKNGYGTVALRDTSGDGRADIIRYFGNYSGTGLHIHKGYLYVGHDSGVVRYRFLESELVPDTAPEVIVSGFIYDHQHAAKSIAFDQEGFIYVNVGAPSNSCQQEDRNPASPGMDPCPILSQFGGIWRFRDDVPNQTQAKVGYRYATGLRNCVALDWNNQSRDLYAVMHGRDQLNQLFPEYYDDEDNANLPAEEFFRLKEGSDGGWPYCYYDGIKDKKVLAPEYGGQGDSTGRCENSLEPLMAFPAHTAPNDLLFYTASQFPESYLQGAFIAFHGSWNRSPKEQEGYYVAFVPFRDGLPSAEWEVFADGFAGHKPVLSPGDAVHRPMGLAQGPDGSLYVSDSRRGTVWRIMFANNL
jgi:glucose/arabinose dehydrogenase